MSLKGECTIIDGIHSTTVNSTLILRVDTYCLYTVSQFICMWVFWLLNWEVALVMNTVGNRPTETVFSILTETMT